MSSVIGIIGAKGGVGKTTIALNLGCVLAQAGRQVTVVDGDLHTPHVSLYLGYTHPPIALHDVLSCKASLEQAMYMHPSGVRVIPGSIAYESISRVSYAEFGQFCEKLRNVGELVIIDGPSGFGPQLDAVMHGVDSVIIVTTPDLPAQADALKSVLKAREMGKHVLGIVVNRATERTDHKAVCAFVGAPLLGLIREDTLVADALAACYPIVFSYPDAISSRGFTQLAASIVGGSHG